jgi:hypothetical protein
MTKRSKRQSKDTPVRGELNCNSASVLEQSTEFETDSPGEDEFSFGLGAKRILGRW